MLTGRAAVCASRIGLCLALCLLAACAPAGARREGVAASTRAVAPATADRSGLELLSASAGVGGGHVRTDLSADSIALPELVPVRRYRDVFTDGGRNFPVIVEYAWDYREGVAVETVRDASGAQISRTAKPGLTLNFTDRELELAIALARADPQLQTLLSANDLNFYAGFPYRQTPDADCSKRSRCVHVIVSAGNGERHVAHAIVDLMTRKVVHPYLDPERLPDPIPAKS